MRSLLARVVRRALHGVRRLLILLARNPALMWTARHALARMPWAKRRLRRFLVGDGVRGSQPHLVPVAYGGTRAELTATGHAVLQELQRALKHRRDAARR